MISSTSQLAAGRRAKQASDPRSMGHRTAGKGQVPFGEKPAKQGRKKEKEKEIKDAKGKRVTTGKGNNRVEPNRAAIGG